MYVTNQNLHKNIVYNLKYNMKGHISIEFELDQLTNVIRICQNRATYQRY